MDILVDIPAYLTKLEEFKSSEEFKFFLTLRENRTVLSILRGNYYELIKCFKHHNNPEHDDLVWSSDTKFRWKLQRSLIRVLTNYLNSISSTIGYSQNNSLKRIQHDSILLNKLTKKRKQQFEESPLHNFIIKLRNYVSHDSYLKITSLRSFTIEKPEGIRTIYISKSQFLGSDMDLNNKGKVFLQAQSDKVYLVDALSEHYIEFVKFQNFEYKIIVEANKNLVERLLVKLDFFYNEAVRLNLKHILPFDKIYLRYLNHIVRL